MVKWVSEFIIFLQNIPEALYALLGAIIGYLLGEWGQSRRDTKTEKKQINEGCAQFVKAPIFSLICG